MIFEKKIDDFWKNWWFLKKKLMIFEKIVIEEKLQNYLNYYEKLKKNVNFFIEFPWKIEVFWWFLNNLIMTSMNLMLIEYLYNLYMWCVYVDKYDKFL